MPSLIRILEGFDDIERRVLSEATPFATSHFTVEFSKGEWWLKVPHQEPRVLVGGDDFAGLTGAWLFDAEVEARDDAIEQRALASNDEGAWQVLSDWLTERGDPLGTVIAQNAGVVANQPLVFRGPGDEPNSEGPLVGHFRSGVLTRLSCRFSSHTQLIAELLRPRSRFLQELVLQPNHHNLPIHRALQSTIHVLSRAMNHQHVERLVLGELIGTPNDLRPISVAELRRVLPRLRSAEPKWSRTAWLELVTPGRIPLVAPSGWEVRQPMAVSMIDGALTLAPRERPPGDEWVFEVGRSQLWLHSPSFERGVASSIEISCAGSRVWRLALVDGDELTFDSGAVLRVRLGDTPPR